TVAAGTTIDFRNSFNGLNGFNDVVNQKTCLPMFDDLTAGTEVHGDYRHTCCIGFSQNQSEPFRDCVQMEQSKAMCKQFILPSNANRPDVADILIIDVGFNLFLKVGFILDNSGDDQAPAA